MRLKFKTPTIVKSFYSCVQNQFNTSIESIRYDNECEFMLKDFYSDKRILHQTSCVGTPQQNGIIERKHQHLLGLARALMFQSKFPQCFWAHAITHAVHLINRYPTRFLSQKSPFQILFGKLPNFTFLKTFGSLCYPSTNQANRKKFDSRSRKPIFLGFKTGTKGYALFDLHPRETFISRDVFFETTFPFHSIDSERHPTQSTQHVHSTFYDAFTDFPSPHPAPASSTNIHSSSPTDIPPDLPSDLPEPETIIPVTKKSSRPKRTPSYLLDYHYSLLTNSIHPSVAQSLKGTLVQTMD